MSHFKALPTEDRVKNLNKYQWLWCCYNIMENRNDKIEETNNIIEYLTYFINPELAKTVKENRNKKDNKYKEENISYSNETYNDSFEDEISQYLDNENFVELPSSDFKASTESKDDFIKRALQVKKMINNNDDLDIFYTNE